MTRGAILLIVALPVAIFFLDRANLLRPVKGAVSAVVSPVTGVVTQAATSVGEFIRVVGDFPTLVRENNALKAENTRLQAELADKLAIMHENDHLRSELSLPAAQRNPQGIAAFIVGRSRTGPFGTFTLNRGERDGIREGLVATSQGALVGRISEVFAGTSTLVPITNVNSVIPVVLVESRGQGLLKGGVKGLVVEEISRDVDIVPGEAVVTSDLGGVVPAGLLVGDVEAIAGGEADVFQSAAVTSPVPLNWLELVIIFPETR